MYNFSKSLRGKKRINKEEFDNLSNVDKEKFSFQVLDEDFSPGPADDVSFTFRVRSAGKHIYIAPFWVDHHRMTENFNDKSDLAKKAMRYFKKKYYPDPIEEMEVAGETILLHPEARKMHGCFRDEDIADIETHKEIRAICETFTDDDAFLDIGANIGTMSLMLEKGRCFAFEPTKKTYEMLVENVKRNHWKRITPINLAVAGEEFHYKVNENEILIGMNSISEDEKGPRTVVLDKAFKDRDFRIRLIKTDTEGRDEEVLSGAREIIMKDRPIVISENNVHTLMTELGYVKTKNRGDNEVWEPK